MIKAAQMLIVFCVLVLSFGYVWDSAYKFRGALEAKQSEQKTMMAFVEGVKIGGDLMAATWINGCLTEGVTLVIDGKTIHCGVGKKL